MLRLITLFLAVLVATAAPTGTYTGSKTVLGESINAKVTITSENTLDLTIAGAFALECDLEKFHLDGATVELDDIGNADDCIAKTLAEESVTLKTIVFDEKADTVTVSVKYSVLNLDLVLTKDGLDFDFTELLATTPTGIYAGSKTVLGETINAQVTIESATSLEFTISGLIDIDCIGEEYTMSGSDISITHITESGDCAHDALADNSVTLKGITYNDSSDEITVSVKYSVMSIDLTLSKTGAIGWKITSLPPLSLSAAPTGNYFGSVTKLGQTVNTEVDVIDATTMNLKITGIINIDCAGEAYSMSGSDITVDHVTESGDCAHDALDSNNVELKSITYDEANDEVTVTVKYSVMTIPVVLSKKSMQGIVGNLRGAKVAVY